MSYSGLTIVDDFGTVATTTRPGNLSPRRGNSGINFRWLGLDAHFLANWTAEKYKSTVTSIEVFNEARTMYDVKLQYRFGRRYDAFLDINNLTDEAPRTDVSLNGLKFFRTNQGVGFTAGVRARF